MKCPQKRQYKSQEQAMRYARFAERQYHKKIRVYQCDLCGKWHLATIKWWR
jgi:hypothetical protein